VSGGIISRGRYLYELLLDAAEDLFSPFLAFLCKHATASSFGPVMRIAAFSASVFPMVELWPLYSIRIT
jgi:hypothetical protein